MSAWFLMRAFDKILPTLFCITAHVATGNQLQNTTGFSPYMHRRSRVKVSVLSMVCGGKNIHIKCKYLYEVIHIYIKNVKMYKDYIK